MDEKIMRYEEIATELSKADADIRFLELLLNAPRGAIRYRNERLKEIHSHYQHLSSRVRYSEKGQQIKDLLDAVNQKADDEWRKA